MTILAIIDCQNDFITGTLGTPEAKEIPDKIEKDLETNEYIKIVATADSHFDDYKETQEGKKLPIEHCIFDSWGWRFPTKIDNIVEEVFIKRTFGYAYWGDLLKPYVETYGCKNLKIKLVGLCTDICVITNALVIKTFFPEIEVIVDANLCAGTTPEKHKAALEVMKSCQITVINE